MNDNLIKWIEAENKISEIKRQISDLESVKLLCECERNQARDAIHEDMLLNGVTEDIIDGGMVNYKLYYTTPRQSVKADAEATPDEFCKIERVPKLKEIKEFLDAGNQVNWASVQLGESKLTYKVVKK